MERRWFKRTITRLKDYQYLITRPLIYLADHREVIRRYGLLLITAILAWYSLRYALVYDWLPDLQAQPVFLLQIPLLLWKYTWSASFILAVLDPTGFLPAEVCAVFFSVAFIVLLGDILKPLIMEY
jgi:hypothetical protein